MYSKIFYTSNITTSINVPEEFSITELKTVNNTLIINKDFEIKLNINGTHSLIEFKTIPYIDYSKYDHDRRMFFTVDKYNSIWRTYEKNDYIIEENAVLSSSGFITTKYYSMENILKNFTDCFVVGPTNLTPEYLQYITDLDFKKYKPIKIAINNEELTDITDYSFNTKPKLDTISPDKNKQFYLDRNKIYTNLDLAFYGLLDVPQNLSITYFSTTSKINIACYMNTNSSKYSNYTPVVDYYILKLTGQTV